MLLNAYTLYDAKALTYSPPFYATAHGAAVRMVMDLASDQNTSVGRHPSDFSLYCVGQWNDAVGCLLPADVRQHISDVLPLIPARPPTSVREYFANADAAANGSTS